MTPGRPREFDRAEALSRAMEAFWSKGYEQTQIDDLVEAMSIGRGSMYAAFGDKRSLYLEALDAFIERVSRAMRDRLLSGPGTPLQQLRAFIESWPALGADASSRGCFLTNSLIERGAHDPDVAQRAARTLRAEEMLYRGIIDEAVERAELPPGTDAGMIARAIVNARLGLTLQVRLGPVGPSGAAAAAATLRLLT